MALTYQLKKWDTQYPVIITVLRVVLGIYLTVRGISFLSNTALLEDVIRTSYLGTFNLDSTLALLITWIHLLGGTFIILGLFTKFAVWAQMPVVVGAIIFINTRHGLFSTPTDLLLSIVVLALLILFAAGGAGQISMDQYLKKYLL